MAWLRNTNVVPVLIVLAAIVVFWYAMAVSMNAPWQQTLNERAGLTDVPLTEFAQQTWAQDKPVLPSPHQVFAEIYDATILETNVRRSLVYARLGDAVGDACRASCSAPCSASGSRW